MALETVSIKAARLFCSVFNLKAAVATKKFFLIGITTLFALTALGCDLERIIATSTLFVLKNS